MSQLSTSRLGFAAAAAIVSSLVLVGCSPTATTETPTTPGEATADFVTDDRIDDDALRILGVYDLDGTEVLGDIEPSYAAVWDRFTELVDVTQWPEITLFVALDRDASPRGTEGAVAPLATDPSKYFVALDVTGVQSQAELDATMIHEFAHLVTLRADQIPRDTSEADSCPVYTFNQRCPNPGSYFALWVEQFWPGYTEAEQDAEDPSAQEDRWAVGEFVTEYAASAPYEDIAETFSVWVVSNAEPSGDSVLDQKLRFFDDFPELVELKKYARESLNS